MAFGDPVQPQMMQMLPMPQMQKPQGGGMGGMGDMGMKLLQAALKQQGQNAGALAAQPQVGATMPGGAMNITPPTLPAGGGGLGMLAQLFGRGGGGSAVPPLTSESALY